MWRLIIIGLALSALLLAEKTYGQLSIADRNAGVTKAAVPTLQPRSAPKGIPSALYDYVAAEDNTYRWTLLSTEDLGPKYGKLHTLELVSQTWQSITWKHLLAVYEPAELKHPTHCLLYITGGKTDSQLRDGDKQMGAELARLTGAYSATLIQVPNQPHLGDRYEDDLITETFLRYLDTKDATWPLLFPMAKSAVRAMDAIAEFTSQTNGTPADEFVVTGASKRGWTTWLSGVVEPRVIGIAPMVIDTLNFSKQTKYQKKIWGEYSEQIIDYTSKGLVELMEERPEVPLFEWVDPYTYREQLTLPKLLINGTNDRYWVVDAMNNYWDDLVGPKFLLYIPNAGHSLKGGREKVVRTYAAFALHLITKTPFPEVSWEYEKNDDTLMLTVNSKTNPKQVHLWSADSETLDFREEEWSSSPMQTQSDKLFSKETKLPASGHIAVYAEVIYEVNGLPYSFCTQVHRE